MQVTTLILRGETNRERLTQNSCDQSIAFQIQFMMHVFCLAQVSLHFNARTTFNKTQQDSQDLDFNTNL
jgi:hypothetical protein